jgi:putative sigma-54 modulation protein
MPLQITARNVELSAEIRAHIEARVDRFRKLVDQISVLDVIVTLQRGHYTVEVVVKTHCFNAIGAETDADLRAAIDRVMGKAERQLHKQIDKRRTAKRQPREVRERQALTLTLPVLGEVALEADEESRIVRSRRIAAKPMSVQEAADQLEIEAGAFLVFYNAETEKINIIYRREDGRFGLIEPS